MAVGGAWAALAGAPAVFLGPPTAAQSAGIPRGCLGMIGRATEAGKGLLATLGLEGQPASLVSAGAVRSGGGSLLKRVPRGGPGSLLAFSVAASSRGPDGSHPDDP